MRRKDLLTSAYGYPFTDFAGPPWTRLPRPMLAPDDPGGGGGNDDDPEDDPDDDKIDKAEVAKLVKEAVAKETAGLKANNKELKDEKKKLQDALAQFEGIDPEEMRALMARFADDEEAKLIKDGKIDEVVAKRTERLVKDKDKEISARDEKIAKLEGENQEITERLKKLVVDGALREAASKAGVLPTAVEDALTRGAKVFQVGEDDEPVARDPEGTIIIGSDGKTPLSPLEWMTGLKETAPHMFPTSSGGGAAGSNGKGQGGPNPFMKETWNLTEQAILKRNDPQKYDRLKAAADNAAA